MRGVLSVFFSVVLPIYKVEKYLARCIESVLSQTFSDFELILVDDGSPDKCPEICDEYAKKDSRIIVVHKENGGLVSARQAGVKIARGEYVLNLDSDDAIENHTLQTAYDIIKSTNSDIVTFSVKHYINGKTGDAIHCGVDEGLYSGETLENVIYSKLLADKNMKHIAYFLSGKIIRSSIAIPNQLKVSTKISLGEDVLSIVPCFLQAQNVYVSHDPVYLYTMREDSMSVSSFTRQMSQLNVLIKELKQIDISKIKDGREQFSRYCCYMCFALLAFAAEEKAFEKIGELEDIILNSEFADELIKAEFDEISIKSRIAISLLKRKQIKPAFYFLYICKVIKNVLKR